MKRHIGQVAVVVSDQQHSVDFYSKVFGMDHIFGTAEFRGPDLDKVQRMEKAASSTRWLIDDREMFQLEVFRFENPPSRPLPVPGLGRARWLVELIRCRAGESADFEVEACDDTGRLALPSEVAHGSSQKEIGRRIATG